LDYQVRQNTQKWVFSGFVELFYKDFEPIRLFPRKHL